ncbi:Mannosyl-oligosaccharide 1,2-alpha-mannosidase IA [Bagarius yarrelli]|uniref:Mannosyl-oligosaccharide 1,2-alpha-mannosidase IA n=1 Tax=Bagarius yarrelli TaxID=175774 RepID=A0A556UYB0_BAGYA|nr:Mannosyl-oligosaccharide 1,2-alpha-mannosidase IA [Bagarius yarrelli]
MPVAILMPFTSTPSRKSVSATSFRLTEKFVLLLVFSAFITFCFGAIFFLPDSSKLFFFRSDPAVESDTRTGTDGDFGGTGKDEKILAKIRKDHEQVLLEAKDTLQKRPDEIKQDIRSEKDQVAKKRGGENVDGALPVIEYVQPPGAMGREPSDPETREKRAKIKERMALDGSQSPLNAASECQTNGCNFTQLLVLSHEAMLPLEALRLAAYQ